MRDGRMHQTTVRFGPDLWEALEEECLRLGVSAAHFLREAALARLAYTAGRRGDVEYAEAYAGVDPALAEHARPALAERASLALAERAGAAVAEARSSTLSQSTGARAAQSAAKEEREASGAVTAQSEHVWRRSRALREQAAELRRQWEGRLE